MKPESVKYLLNCYLREKQFSSGYDDVDGHYKRVKENNITGGAYGPYEHADFVIPEGAASVRETYYDALAPEEAIIAKRIGRQLSELSDDFELCHGYENQAIAIGNRVLQFKERCLFVSPNCGNIEIPIVRKGTSEGVAKVSWRTRDRTAKSGIHYTCSRGDISFAEGETDKTVDIEVIRNQGDKDVCFTVELFNPEEINIGHVNPLTVYISDHSDMYDDERQVIENIINCSPVNSVSFVANCLLERVTVNTFRTALQYQCSLADTVPDELAFAFEICRIASQKVHPSSLYNVISNFFSHLPELEDIGEYFDDFN